jgi:hypothetical protein
MKMIVSALLVATAIGIVISATQQSATQQPEGSAVAQQPIEQQPIVQNTIKKDIRGIYPGMKGADAIALLKKMDCQYSYSDYYQQGTCIFPVDTRKGGIQFHETINIGLAGNLPDTPVWQVSFVFLSSLKEEEISDGISKQFRVRVPVRHPVTFTLIGKVSYDIDGVDIGDNTKLALSPWIAGYSLELWNEKIRAADDAVADEKRRLSSPAPKF